MCKTVSFVHDHSYDIHAHSRIVLKLKQYRFIIVYKYIYTNFARISRYPRKVVYCGREP